MGSDRRVLVAALSVSFLWFLLLLTLSFRKNTRDSTIISIPYSTRGSSFVKLARTKWSSLHQNFKLNCVSRRRVPNGPDPIHNRRAGNSRLPPTRV